ANAKEWQYQEVCYWLNQIEFAQYIPTFAKHKIDGEILLRDMSATILHEDLEVRRFHTGKIVREIQKLKQVWLFFWYLFECAFILLYDLFRLIKIAISAKTQIGELQTLTSRLEKEKKETEEKMEELMNRPKIQDDEMIIRKEEYEAINKEMARLAEQVDRSEEELTKAKEAVVPAQETASKFLEEEVFFSNSKIKHN
ncbi:hypothetical protein RFI_13469, partial [Reticulomyxa filosa]